MGTELKTLLTDGSWRPQTTGTPKQGPLAKAKESLPLPAALTVTPVQRELYRQSTKMSFNAYEREGVQDVVQIKEDWVTLKGNPLARYRVGKTLELVYQMIGIKPDRWPQGSLKKLIIYHVPRCFPNLSPEEILTAFDFAIQGLFQVNLSLYDRDVNLVYITAVLKAYEAYRADQLRDVNKKLQCFGMDRLGEVRRRSALNADTVVQVIAGDYARHLKGLPEPAPPDPVRAEYYDYLADAGLITLDKPERLAAFNVAVGRVMIRDKLPEETARTSPAAAMLGRRLAIRAQFRHWATRQLKPEEIAHQLKDTASYINPNNYKAIFHYLHAYTNDF